VLRFDPLKNQGTDSSTSYSGGAMGARPIEDDPSSRRVPTPGPKVLHPGHRAQRVLRLRLGLVETILLPIMFLRRPTTLLPADAYLLDPPTESTRRRRLPE